MNELLNKSLAQIVSSDHRAAAVFEKYHLDFCCKGKRSLEKACSENKLEVDEVVADLEKEFSDLNAVNTDFDKFSLNQLTEYIVLTHHSYVKKEMPVLLSYLEKIVSKHGVRHPEMVKVLALFREMYEEMSTHMQKEELVLFPRINNISASSYSYLNAPICMMELEHDHAGKLLSEIRELTNNYNPPADACTTYRLAFTMLQHFEEDMHKHVHLENNLLFPKALKFFECSIKN